MIRTLLTTTAIAALLTTGALAQTTTPAPATDAPAMDAPMADPMAADPMATDVAPAVPASILATGYTVTDRDNLASEIMGRAVYSSTADDAQHIGDVNNLVIGDDGEIAAVVIGVGGFLGLGVKDVAVNYSELEWVVAQDGTRRYVLPTTREALETAPEFQAVDSEDVAQTQLDNNMMATDPAMTAPADNAMAPADQPVDNAMAPADQPVDNTAMAPANNTVVTGPIARDTLVDQPITAEELIGTNAYGPADEHLGAIGDVIMGQDATTVEAVIIDFGGFLGIGTKPVAVDIDNLRYATDENGNRYLFVNVTRDQLDAAVAYNADTFEAERNTQILSTGTM